MLTELANITTEIKPIADDEMDCSFQDSLKGARYQNFISNELTLEDVDVQL